MRSKTTCALLVLALMGALIAGCGGSSSKSATSGQKGSPVDRAFVAEMIAHHKMAVEMATTAKNMGEHTQTKQLAGSIISDQNREIAEMTGIAKELGVKPAPVPMGAMHGHEHMDMGGPMSGDAKALGISMDEMGMSMNMSELDTAKPFDRAFVDMMITHHAGAIRMARAELSKGSNPALKKIAQAIVAAQTKEITEMNSWRKQWYGAASPSGGVPTA